MNEREAVVGTRVRALEGFSCVPRGTEGVIDEDYGSGVMVAWDLPDSPLPKGYRAYDGKPAVATGILRDGFDKERELGMLEVVPAKAWAELTCIVPLKRLKEIEWRSETICEPTGQHGAGPEIGVRLCLACGGVHPEDASRLWWDKDKHVGHKGHCWIDAAISTAALRLYEERRRLMHEQGWLEDPGWGVSHA